MVGASFPEARALTGEYNSTSSVFIRATNLSWLMGVEHSSLDSSSSSSFVTILYPLVDITHSQYSILCTMLIFPLHHLSIPVMISCPGFQIPHLLPPFMQWSKKIVHLLKSTLPLLCYVNDFCFLLFIQWPFRFRLYQCALLASHLNPSLYFQYFLL